MGSTGKTAARLVEERVIGGNWGASGYTTMEQADVLGRLLELPPGGRLLDMGSGYGWPGLYLAASTSCRVVLTDVGRDGMHSAARRATSRGLRDRCTVALATAPHPPFRPAIFDGITHGDVLC